MIQPTLILNETFAAPEAGKVYGIHSATQGFLDAFITHARPKDLHFRAGNANEEAAVEAAVARHGRDITLHPSRFGNDISHCAMFYNIPQTNQFWLRQQTSQNLYSICGINHSLTGEGAYTHLRDIFLAPSEAWDAVICTSRASRAVIAGYFEGWADYLSERGGYRLRSPLHLPIIPLGIDTEALSIDQATRRRGRALRDRLGIGENALVVLFFGRLNFSSKAHPYPMFLALEEAKARLGVDVHLIQAGWYPSKPIEEATTELARSLAPSVRLHHVGAVSGADRLDVFAASDVFMSLSDNIQETFGLTLVEAMACGLPVIATDWDGYRDTVQHGRTGFLAATMMAPPGSGEEVGLAHGISGRPYNRYLMDAAQATAVHVGDVRDALVALGSDPALRARMGEAGRRRAVQHFDWGVIIKAYQDLWAELDERRLNSVATHTRANPLHPDPFRLFEDFASAQLELGAVLRLNPDWRRRIGIAFRSATMRSPSDMMVADQTFEALLQAMRSGNALPLGALLDLCAGQREKGIRSVMWMMKAGVLEPADGWPRRSVSDSEPK